MPPPVISGLFLMMECIFCGNSSIFREIATYILSHCDEYQSTVILENGKFIAVAQDQQPQQPQPEQSVHHQFQECT
jgi:hypothetical protein